MEDRQMKTIGEVCRATYQKEEEFGPRKPVPGGAFGYCGLACLHWEGKRREVFKGVRNWYDVGGTENGALLIPPSARLILQCETFVSPSRSQTQKTSDAHRGQKSVFRGVGPGNSFFFEKK